MLFVLTRRNQYINYARSDAGAAAATAELAATAGEERAVRVAGILADVYRRQTKRAYTPTTSNPGVGESCQTGSRGARFLHKGKGK